MTVVVNWAACTGDSTNTDLPFDSLAAAELVALEPVPLLKYLLDTRPNLEYLKCYSILDVCKNTFVVLSPFDLTITVNPTTKFLKVAEFETNFYNRMCMNRGPTDRGYLLSMPPEFVFYSKEDVMAEVMPTQLIDLPKNTAFISGRLNISKWIRPINWTFELVNGATHLEVKRGDPLFAVRFTPKNDDTVKLEQVPFTADLHRVVKACTQVKGVMPRTPLHKLYSIAESYINRFVRR